MEKCGTQLPKCRLLAKKGVIKVVEAGSHLTDRGIG